MASPYTRKSLTVCPNLVNWEEFKTFTTTMSALVNAVPLS